MNRPTTSPGLTLTRRRRVGDMAGAASPQTSRRLLVRPFVREKIAAVNHSSHTGDGGANRIENKGKQPSNLTLDNLGGGG